MNRQASELLSKAGLEHIEPKTGVYEYGSERIEWMYKHVPDILCLFLSNFFTEQKGKMVYCCFSFIV